MLELSTGTGVGRSSRPPRAIVAAGWVMHEALRVTRVGREQGVVPSRDDLRCAPVVDGGGRHQPDAGVPVLVVVVAEKPVAEAKAILVAAEPVGKLRAILEGLEVGLGVRVVVGHIGPAVGPRSA